MKSFSKTVLSASLGLLVAAGSVQAATVEGSLFAGRNKLSDNSAEYLINAPGTSGTTVDIGDRLRGIFVIDTVEQGGSPTRSLLTGSGNNELSGLFDVTIVNKTLSGGLYTFTFGATASFAGEAGGTLNAAVAFYDGGVAHDYIREGCATIAGCEALATNGSLLWVAGFGLNTFWSATSAFDDIAIIGAIEEPGIGGGFNIGLELLQNNGTRLFNAVPCGTVPVGGGLEFCGSGSILGISGATTPFDSFNDVNFVINLVPEPASIALTGLALLGLGVTSRRRKV